jgi:hypothetical protein
VTGSGRPTTIAGRQYVIGSVVKDVDAYFLVTDGKFMKLDPFGFAVYSNVAHPEISEGSVAGDVADPSYADPSGDDAHWPEDTMQQSFGDSCVRLLSAPGAPPRTEVVTNPQGSAASVASGPSASVDDGSGAYVRSGSFDSGSRGRAYLIDARGNAYQLVGDIVPGNLGYGSVRPPVVPDSWIELLGNGVPLSQDLALCSPRQDRSAPCATS